MSLITPYSYKDNVIHRLDPRTKLLWFLMMVVLSIVTEQPAFLAAGIGLVILVSLAAGLDIRRYGPLVKAMIPVTIAVVILQLIFAEGPTFADVGPVGLHSQGFEIAFRVMFRIILIVIVSLQFFMWVHPTDLALTFVAFKVPYRYALLVGLSLRTFPVMERELVRIYDSQAVRGLELKGSLRKIVRLIPVMLPFVLRAMRRTNAVAIAMELRAYGYDKSRTYLRSIHFERADWVASILLAVAALGYLIWYLQTY
ncbi:MAG: energy-coupling factor transporter transmembrane component T family protein [Anaerolineae bacterium]